MSSLEQRLLPVVSGEARGIGPAALRGVLRGLSLIYLGLVEAYLACYRLGIFRQGKLPCKVISVGNLTLGGTGKTTTVRALVRKLTEKGLKVAVLSYGYRADHHGPPSVVSDGSEILMTPAGAGDEAVLLARDLPGTPVIIGPRRIESGRLAAERFGVDAVVMDDGFQYWRLKKDLEIVLINATEPFGFGAVIPRGLLREPVHHLAGAGAIIITHADLVPAERLEALRDRIRRIAPGIPVSCARHAPSSLRDMADGRQLPVNWLKARRVFARAAPGRSDAEQDGGQDRHRRREQQHAPIGPQVESHGREGPLGHEGDQQAAPPPGKRNSQQRS